MSITNIVSINLRNVRREITTFIDEIAMDNRILDTLRLEDIFIPKECELWDYKREANKDTISIAETVLQIVSFYNTYGGYLIYGIDEVVDDIKFVPIGISTGTFDIQQLKQMLTNYTGDRIDISYIELEYEIGSKWYVFGILHVPRRAQIKEPTFFGKNGPEKRKDHLVFHKDTAYIRAQDTCIPARTKEDLQLLFGERNNPYLWDANDPISARLSKNIIVEHNLPDRNFICAKFIGRDEIIQDLWKWLGDELVNAKVLAGDGGKGKTSIAYEFAEEVCRIKPYGIEKVIWLTAKSKQFIGILDEFVRVPQTNYYDLESLLKAVCSEVAILDSETQDASIKMLKRLMKNAFEDIPCLIIIDDVDSTELDQQRMIFETAMQFPNSGARFLLTTRMNITFSSAVCIPVGGFNREDYSKYVNNMLEQFECEPLKSREIERMRQATDGSPLFADSLLRLYRMGMVIDEATKEWKGKLGSEVRKAALQREVESLSLESRRVLLACSYMGEASFTELKQATGYDNERMTFCINELQSLFLISAQPLIKKEQRFTVSNNTGRLILENKELFVSDPTALERIVKKLRKGLTVDTAKKVYLHPVAAAITQTVAFLKENNHDDAVATIDSSLLDYKNNPDLILMRGRCLLEQYKATKDLRYLDMARRAFNRAYKYGQRKELIYNLWYESEILAKHPNGAIEIASLAIENKSRMLVDWLTKRADAYLEMSKAFRRSLNTDLEIDQLRYSARDLSEAIKKSKQWKKPPLIEMLFQINDKLFNIASRVEHGFIGYKDTFDTTISIIKLGDYRSVNFERMVNALGRMYNEMVGLDKVSHGQLSMMIKALSDSKRLIDRAIIRQSLKPYIMPANNKWHQINIAINKLSN